MKEIRWGIVGPGTIANKFARAIKNVEGACLVAVASRSEARGREFAERHGIQSVFSSYKSMAASDCVDAVYIATPHPYHAPCAELFLQAKKHVLCEKPMCLNAKQARKLQAVAEENGMFLMEAMWTRFLPAIKEVCALVKRGEIGEVLSLEADFCYASTPEEKAKMFVPSMGGGSLLDVGIYGLTFASLLFGNQPEEVCSMATIEDGMDAQMNVLLRYEGGAIANVSSAVVLQKPETAYVYGTKGYILIPNFYGATEFYVYIDGEEKHMKAPSIGEGFEEEILEVCSCINAGKKQSDVMPLCETITMLELMDQIRRTHGICYPFDGEYAGNRCF